MGVDTIFLCFHFPPDDDDAAGGSGVYLVSACSEALRRVGIFIGWGGMSDISRVEGGGDTKGIAALSKITVSKWRG